MCKARFLLAFFWFAGLSAACEPMLDKGVPKGEDIPPEKSAFVRFLVGSSPAQTVTMRVQAETLAVVPVRSASPFVERKAGPSLLSLVGDGNRLCETGLWLAPESQTLLVAFSRPDEDPACPLQKMAAFPMGKRDKNAARVRLAHLSFDAPTLSLRDESGAHWFRSVSSGTYSAYATLGRSIQKGEVLRLQGGTEETPLYEWTTEEPLPLDTATTLVAVGGVNPLLSANDFFSLLSLHEESGAVAEIPLAPVATAPSGPVFLFHANGDVGAVETRSDGKDLFGKTAFLQGSALVSLLPGTRKLSIDEAGERIWQGDFRLWPGRGWFVLLWGDKKTPKLLALPKVERVPQTIFRLVHAIEGAGAVDLLDGDIEIVKSLAYGAATDPATGFALRKKTLRLRDRATGASWDIVLPEAAVLASMDQVVSLVLAGNAKPGGAISAHLLIESRVGKETPVPVYSLPTSPTLYTP
jgi:hypothetical protein